MGQNMDIHDYAVIKYAIHTVLITNRKLESLEYI